MQFTHTFKAILDGSKTQTRRIIKPGEYSNEWHLDGDDDLRINEILAPRTKPDKYGMTIGRQVYGVGKTYAVQPGRGKKAVGRFRITGLRREDVREISVEDAKAEGWKHGSFDKAANYPALWYLKLWASMHDEVAHVKLGMMPLEEWREYLKSRPAERYQAWVIEFCFVESEAA